MIRKLDKSEFSKIKDKTWIRVTPPDDPFTSREYKVISSVEPLEYEERSTHYQRTTVPSNYKAYVHAIIKFTPESWAEPGYKIYFPEKVQTISDWDIHHATVVKRITKKTYHEIVEDIFEKQR